MAVRSEAAEVKPTITGIEMNSRKKPEQQKMEALQIQIRARIRFLFFTDQDTEEMS
jgi:hypothetical protein